MLFRKPLSAPPESVVQADGRPTLNGTIVKQTTLSEDLCRSLQYTLRTQLALLSQRN